METKEFHGTVSEALKGAEEACKELSQYVLQSGNYLRIGEIQKGNDLLVGILDDFSQLIYFLEDMSQCYDLEDSVRNGALDTIAKESSQTVELLNMAFEAQENQDWVFLADVLEYELSEKMGSWSNIFEGLSKLQESSLTPA